jgi:coenzyme F420-reducing hydrogenase gamma subunit
MNDQSTVLEIIIHTAASTLKWTDERVRLAIIQGVVEDEGTMELVMNLREEREWLVGWKLISDALGVAVRTAQGYHQKNRDGFRALIERNATGKPMASRERIEQWRYRAR